MRALGHRVDCGTMAEFDEISHTGGQVTIRKKDGAYQLGVRHSSPHRMTMIQIAVGSEGRLLGVIPFGGLDLSEEGEKVQTRPYLQAFLFSDREGLFGRTCPKCSQYFRTTAVGTNHSFCPYCTYRDTSLAFLTKNQIKFLQAFLNKLLDAPEGETVIDLDRLIEALPENKSAWVYTEERQQMHFKCACDAECDVLGEYVLCAACGRRTNGVVVDQKFDHLLAMLDEIEALPEGLIRSSRTEDVLVACVAVLEGTGNDIRQQLTRFPMTPSRRQGVGGLNFQNVFATAGSLRNWFAIDLLRGISDDDQRFVKVMFNRRHLLSHTAGRVTDKYVKRTGDDSVRVNQRIKIDVTDVRRLLPLVRLMSSNLLKDFESIG